MNRLFFLPLNPPHGEKKTTPGVFEASNTQRASQAVLHAQRSKASNTQRASQAVLHTQVG